MERHKDMQGDGERRWTLTGSAQNAKASPKPRNSSASDGPLDTNGLCAQGLEPNRNNANSYFGNLQHSGLSLSFVFA